MGFIIAQKLSVIIHPITVFEGESEDKDVQFEALQNLLAATDKEVDWAYGL
ncbi:hypothetical protein J2TS4_12350 [Paenibacillus sp. J2TS4]|nr:hypothetical protein J2TS4_12350 [Paenibacillus sp. J2TS4]